MVRERLQAGAALEAVEDRDLVEESTDWQRCLAAGLVSRKVAALAVQSYVETTGKRYERMAANIDETLMEDESAILMVGDNHRVQFPSDIEVFYVSPPALDEVRRWIDDQMRQQPPAPQESVDQKEQEPEGEAGPQE